MRRQSTLACVLIAWAFMPGSPIGRAQAVPEANLLRNPGFEEDLSPVWEKRTPEDADRKLYRTKDLAHSGQWCAVLENVKPAFTRLR